MNQREKELKELEQIEKERRKASQEDFVVSIFKKILNVFVGFSQSCFSL